MTDEHEIDYEMRISRLTVDKLGVKLYDKVSAVIAELIANAYDADATKVIVHAPMGQFLASRAGGVITDKGFEIQIVDNGIGMTPEQMQNFFLVVGAERRNRKSHGDESPRRRKVMGRKGVGKLAPFGICKTIEVISAGGERASRHDEDSSPSGYLTSHIVLDYDSIVNLDDERPDERYKPVRGCKNRSLSPEPGTQIILKNFNQRKVPEIDRLDRELAQRFGIQSPDWKVQLSDNTKANSSPITVGKFRIDTTPNTEIAFKQDGTEHGIVFGPDGKPDSKLCAGFYHDDNFYPLSGWMAYAKSPYTDELMAGVRIYCRGKIAAQTSIFNRPAGFTGEHNIRSYLVGELHADWLDEKEDLIQTDRRDILWSDDLGVEFEKWGQNVVKQIGTLSRDPMRKATLDLFFGKGNVEARISEAYPGPYHNDIRKHARILAQSFGRAMSNREVDDTDTVNRFVNYSIVFAPFFTFDSKMKEAVEQADNSLDILNSILRTARVAEVVSFGQIAENRIKVLKRLEKYKNAEHTEEKDLQQLIAEAPWLINPEWAPITENRTFRSLCREFERYYEKKTGSSISLLPFKQTGKRPDFVLFSQEGKVQIIEIKKPRHKLNNDEMLRIISYYNNMNAFLNDPSHASFKKEFSDFHITVVCDALGLTEPALSAFDGYRDTGKLTHIDWAEFFLKTEHVHQDYLDEAERQRTAAPAES